MPGKPEVTVLGPALPFTGSHLEEVREVQLASACLTAHFLRVAWSWL